MAAAAWWRWSRPGRRRRRRASCPGRRAWGRRAGRAAASGSIVASDRSAASSAAESRSNAGTRPAIVSRSSCRPASQGPRRGHAPAPASPASARRHLVERPPRSAGPPRRCGRPPEPGQRRPRGRCRSGRARCDPRRRAARGARGAGRVTLGELLLQRTGRRPWRCAGPEPCGRLGRPRRTSSATRSSMATRAGPGGHDGAGDARTGGRRLRHPGRQASTATPTATTTTAPPAARSTTAPPRRSASGPPVLGSEPWRGHADRGVGALRPRSSWGGGVVVGLGARRERRAGQHGGQADEKSGRNLLHGDDSPGSVTSSPVEEPPTGCSRGYPRIRLGQTSQTTTQTPLVHTTRAVLA